MVPSIPAVIANPTATAPDVIDFALWAGEHTGEELLDQIKKSAWSRRQDHITWWADQLHNLPLTAEQIAARPGPRTSEPCLSVLSAALLTWAREHRPDHHRALVNLTCDLADSGLRLPTPTHVGQHLTVHAGAVHAGRADPEVFYRAEVDGLAYPMVALLSEQLPDNFLDDFYDQHGAPGLALLTELCATRTGLPLRPMLSVAADALRRSH